MSQPEINPPEAWANEELSEAELDALSGGLSNTLSTNSLSTLLVNNSTVLQPTENLFSSYTGTKGDFDSAQLSPYKPMNLSLVFL